MPSYTVRALVGQMHDDVMGGSVPGKVGSRRPNSLFPRVRAIIMGQQQWVEAIRASIDAHSSLDWLAHRAPQRRDMRQGP